MDVTSVERFKRKLTRSSGYDLELVINENRSTMLNVLERKKTWARLSVHKMFLDAPENVISAIAHYVRGTRRDRAGKDLLIRGYIQSNLNRFNYSHLLDENKMSTEGRYYDLAAIYEKLNSKYFRDELDLKITWYGTWGRKTRRKVTFGQYFDHLKLVKIHRLLDDPFFPEYFVEFVVYHEMLHHLVPGHFDEKGIFRVHGQDFKELERKFEEYDKAIQWEKRHKDYFFSNSCRK
jgi:predicted SprT family Zn-dependent metalloprotease